MLPFLEYKIHCKIVKKLQILGMNAVIQLKVTISLGETVVVATAVRNIQIAIKYFIHKFHNV